MQAKLQRFENMRARWDKRTAVNLLPDKRPHDLIPPDALLNGGEHDPCFTECLRSYLRETGDSRPDIHGLRRYRKKSWLRFLPGFR
jgi:hypothetical protein